MKLTTLILIAGIPILTTLGFAQQTDFEKLRCSTSDGTVIITSSGISLRDYSFRIDRVISDGVIRLTDSRAGASAILDTRSEDGIYLAITERGATMQVVAARANMHFDPTPPDADGGASPSAAVSSDHNLIVLAQTRP